MTWTRQQRAKKWDDEQTHMEIARAYREARHRELHLSIEALRRLTYKVAPQRAGLLHEAIRVLREEQDEIRRGL